MKRKFLCILSMFFVCLPAVVPAFAASAGAEGERQVLQCERGAIFADNACGTAVLSAVRESDVFYRDIRISLCEKGEKKAEIVPSADGGYNPHIELVSFDGETEQIFYGADSGGSGGYGYYFVYRASAGGAEELFSSETFEIPYTARYINGFKAEVTNTRNGTVSLIDLSDRDADYLSQIYREDGTLIEPRARDVGGVNSAAPFYNNAQGRYGLEIYARITGLYGADALGYIVMRTAYENGGFTSFFDMTAVYAG